MQPKTLPTRILVLTVFLELVLSLILVLNLSPQDFSLFRDKQTQDGLASLVRNNTAATVKQKQASFGLPVRLKIPAIGVDSAIAYVGLTPDGAMDVPKGPDGVAWYELGPRPGEIGNAVISGHYGWKNNIPAVFDTLYKLRAGDTLYIEDAAGTIISFVVRESKRYGENADASDVFASYDGKSHLNLITCEGVWNKVSKSYSKRLVVFADKK